MRREIRNYIATACFALCLASFSSELWLFYQYQSTRPRRPERGFVHVLNNHGSYVYLTDADATGLSFLFLMFLLGFLLGGLIVPKKYTLKGTETDLVNPTLKRFSVLCAAAFSYVALIIFIGPRIVALAVAHGFVISI